MTFVISSKNDGGMALPSDGGNTAVGEEKTVASTSGIGSVGDFGFSTVAPSGEAARIGIDGSNETRLSDKGSSKKTSAQRRKLGDHKKQMSSVEGYYYIASTFDAGTEAVGYGLKIGDMVWGKVKSHPWWPGFIYNEAFASLSVRRGKHEGHVLVAFFGDSSYGWFDPDDLIPFEENFAEKSRQSMSRAFLTAVEEAVDELSRRSSLGLACRCRNEFNFWPSNLEGYYVVDVGGYEPGVYGSNQISKARDSFQITDMLSFILKMALEPMNYKYWTIDFIKNKAAALAYRKAQFEEFDDTYSQAFGNVQVRPLQPTVPVAVDPSKAPLSGRLVIAEALWKGKVLVKTAQTKDQVQKDKYMFKRREESIQLKSKKASSGQAGHTHNPLYADWQYSGIIGHMHQASETGIVDAQRQPPSHQASMSNDSKHSEGSKKLVEGGTKKFKVLKRPAGELISENGISVKKKKKSVISIKTGVKPGELPVAVSKSTGAAEHVSGMSLDVQLIDNNELGNQKKDVAVGSSSSQSQQEVDFVKVELQMLVRDLCALALNPFHGERRSCPAVIQQVFLKFRSLVCQKSLVLVSPTESEAIEVNSSRLLARSVLVGPVDKSSDKIVKLSAGFDDSTKAGNKRSSSDHPEGIKKKKVDDSLNTKKKKIDNSKFLTAEKIFLQRSTESQRGDVKGIAGKAMSPKLPKAVKLEQSERMEPAPRAASPTMLVMKFPAGAALPSGAELRAKFARFGPVDHSATRIFWKSYTCRLVFLHKIHAEAALNSAAASRNLFGNANVRCYLKEMEVEVDAAESEPVKLPKEDASVGASQSRESAVDHRIVPKISSQPLQQPEPSVQLKSCLKKPSGDESGNGGGRGTRVKFVLGGEESSKDEFPYKENKKNNIASVPQNAASIHSSLDLSSKILPKFNPQSSNYFAPASSFQKFAVSTPSEQGARGFNPPPTPQVTGALPINNDLSQQMLNLLTRCNEVVNNLRAAFGHMPYHPL